MGQAQSKKSRPSSEAGNGTKSPRSEKTKEQKEPKEQQEKVLSVEKFAGQPTTFDDGNFLLHPRNILKYANI